MRSRHVITLVALAVLCGGLAASPAQAATAEAAAKGDCPARKGTLAKNGIGRIWHRKASIYGCSTVYGKRPKARRLGPYKRGTRVAFNGESYAFTVSVERNGVRSDRVYAGKVSTGMRWLVSRRLVPAGTDTPARDARIQRLSLADESVAWVTRDGDVVVAMREPAGDPEPIGELPKPLKVDRNLLLVGSFPDADATDLADSMKLVVGDGEGDECGGGNPYELTVRPTGSGERVGVDWDGYWTSSSPVCT